MTQTLYPLFPQGKRQIAFALLALLLQTLLVVKPVQAEPSAGAGQEIGYLLRYVEATDCLYERNGDRHNGKEAVAHIRKKYDYFRDEIQTAEDFIRLSATKSTISGRYYQVFCPNAQAEKSQDWLLRALKAYRTGQ